MKIKTKKKNSIKDKKIADLEFIIQLQERVIDCYDNSLADISSRFIEYAKAFWHNQSVHERELEDWIKKYNEIVKELTESYPHFNTIPMLPNEKFQIDPKDIKYGIHWTNTTANEMLTHWLNHLN